MVNAFADPGETLLFYDWDDTLFPTTDLFHHWNLPCWPNKWTPELLETITDNERLSLRHYGDALVRYLSIALSLSARVVIVTNASPGWVMSCVTIFAPQALPLFQLNWGIRVVYACEIYEKHAILRRHASVCAPVASDSRPLRAERETRLSDQKHLAFWAEALRFYGRKKSGKPERCWANILSFGDAPYERHALLDLDFRRVGPLDENLRIKTVTVAECRTVAEMTWDFEVERLFLPALVRHDGRVDVSMQDVTDKLGLLSSVSMDEAVENVLQQHAASYATTTACGPRSRIEQRRVSVGAQEIFASNLTQKVANAEEPRSRSQQRSMSIVGNEEFTGA